jgi:two-component system, chemotaxis family, protein-glutamate methylesterase/glutaminase
LSKTVLIVDDSALVRKQLSELIVDNLGFDVEFAKNGKEAVDMASAKDYDVITMDINMPVMDGLTAVGEIMKNNPTPILMVSSLTSENASTTMEALELGAIDYITKPGTMNIGRRENSVDILDKVEALSKISRRRLSRRVTRRPVTEKSVVAQRVPHSTGESKSIRKIILIGASTGGPGLIEQLCASFPADFPHPVCVVQHMPEQFTEAFAARLNRVSNLEVHHSKHGMEVLPGNIYIARGGTHMKFNKKVSGTIAISEDDNDYGRFFKPSVDEMYLSALTIFGGSKIVAVILTGIGDDGADGMYQIRKAGGYTIGESEESCTVYGMPRVAYENGGVQEQLDFSQIVKKVATIR